MKMMTALMTLAMSTTVFAAGKKTSFSVSSVQSASGYGNEIQIGSVGNGSLLSEKQGTNTVTTIGARASYSYLFTNFADGHFQAGGEGRFTSVSGGASYSAFDAIGFATWNLDTDLKDSWYGKGGAGLFNVPNATGGTDSKFGFFVAGGVRVPILGNINYNPEIRLYKKGDLDPSFEVLFLNASVFF